MRYIGGKSNLLKDIGNLIVQSAGEAKRIIDIFFGSGVVAAFFKNLGYDVIGNDVLYFAYVLSRGLTALNDTPAFKRLGIKSPVDYLNDLTLEVSGFQLENCFVYQNYSPHDEITRMYFQNDNAIKFDIIRMTVEKKMEECQFNQRGRIFLPACNTHICCSVREQHNWRLRSIP